MSENRKKIIKNFASRKIKENELKEALKKPPFSSNNIPKEKLNNSINADVERVRKERIQKREQARKKLFENELRKIPMGNVYNNRNNRNQRVFNSKGTPKFNELAPFVYPETIVKETPEWFTNTKKVDISIIVPLYKSQDVIVNQINNWVFDDDDGLTKEIIYIDDCCPNKSYEKIISTWDKHKNSLKSPIGKILYNTRNAGYGPSCNIGVKHASGKFLIFLNADTTVTKNWIKPMIELFENKTVGIVGNMHLKEKNVIDSLGSEWSDQQKTFLHIGKNIYKGNILSKPFNCDNLPDEFKKTREVKMVTGACFMIEKDFFFKIKQFDTDYRIGYWEDADLCMKCITAGKRVLFTPESKIFHKSGHSHAGGHPYQLHNRNTFFKKWLDTGLLSSILDKKIPDKQTVIPKEKIVVYTAITKNYDDLKDQRSDLKNSSEFTAFLDTSSKSNFWDVKSIEDTSKDSNRNAKIYKILPHKFFPEKEYSLWIDGSITIDFSFDLNRLIDIYLSDADLAIFQHPQRTCIYQEANICISRGLDDAETIRKQIARYTKEGYPVNNGLVEATVILRRHTDKIKKFNEMWWEEICNGSRRDQISFNYVAKKLNLKYNYFNGNLRKKNYLFKLNNHNR